MAQLHHLKGVHPQSGSRTPDGFLLSPHACGQAWRRSIVHEDVDFVLSAGEFRRDRLDRSIYFLSESPFSVLSVDQRRHRLQGLVVVLAPDGKTIVTVYSRDWRFNHSQDVLGRSV